jgi:hypothetical protein
MAVKTSDADDDDETAPPKKKKAKMRRAKRSTVYRYIKRVSL